MVAAADAQLLGRGGISRVSAASGLSRTTIHRGLRELQGDLVADERVRGAGGGRKQIKLQQPAVLKELEQLVAPATRGDPMSPLRWTCKSTSKLAAELRRKGHAISARTVARLLQKDLDYSLQANRKTKEGASHPDRNAQFEHIAAQTRAFQQRGQPVISVDTKKKELVGEFKNGGREWQPIKISRGSSNPRFSRQGIGQGSSLRAIFCPKRVFLRPESQPKPPVCRRESRKRSPTGADELDRRRRDVRDHANSPAIFPPAPGALRYRRIRVTESMTWAATAAE